MPITNFTMGTTESDTVFHKLWRFLRAHVLTLMSFDLNCQGALVVLIILQSNIFLLLRREAGTGFIPALIEDWVFIAAGAVVSLGGAAAGWWGTARRQYTLSAWLALTAVCGLLVLAFPPSDAGQVSVVLCGGESVTPLTDELARSWSTPRVWVLILTVVFSSLAIVVIWTHGLTYLDDHEPQNGPFFYGILISIRLSLGLSSSSWLQPVSVGEDWWVANLALSMLTLMFALLQALYPRQMPNFKEAEVTDDTRFLPSLKRVLSNKAVMVQSIALAFLTAAVFEFVKYDNSFVQARFQVEAIRQDPQTSRAVSDILQGIVVVFFVMIFRVRFSVRRDDGVKANTASKVGGVVAVVVAVMFAVVAALPCAGDPVAGLESGSFEQPSCSQECGCTAHKYGFSPVCALDTAVTYLSPCNAGCKDYESLNGFLVYHNCTCGSAVAVRGSCSLAACRASYSFYLVFYTLVVAVSGAAFLMQGMVVLRAVSRHDKPLALGVSFAMVALVAQVPGHLVYMLISYLTCAYNGELATPCVLHAPTAWAFAAASAVFSLASAGLSFLACRYRGAGGGGDETNTENS